MRVLRWHLKERRERHGIIGRWCSIYLCKWFYPSLSISWNKLLVGSFLLLLKVRHFWLSSKLRVACEDRLMFNEYSPALKYRRDVLDEKKEIICNPYVLDSSSCKH